MTRFFSYRIFDTAISHFTIFFYIVNFMLSLINEVKVFVFIFCCCGGGIRGVSGRPQRHLGQGIQEWTK